MFLNRFYLLNKTTIFNSVKSFRLISQTSFVQNESHSKRKELPCNVSNSKQTILSSDMTSSMKLPVFKRLPRKKPAWKDINSPNQYEGQYYNLSAYATADWYDLDCLKERLQTLSKPFHLINISDLIENVLCVQIKRDAAQKSQAFIFDDGAVIFWNVQIDDEKLILKEAGSISFTG